MSNTDTLTDVDVNNLLRRIDKLAKQRNEANLLLAEKDASLTRSTYCIVELRAEIATLREELNNQIRIVEQYEEWESSTVTATMGRKER